MANLLIENLPDELCVEYARLSDADRTIVFCALADAIHQFGAFPPTLEEWEDFHRRQRELQAAGLVKPVSTEMIDEAIFGGRRC